MSSVCLASEVPQASPRRASSRIFSGCVKVKLRGSGPSGSLETVQKKSSGSNQLRELVDGQHESIEDSSTPRKGHQPPPDRVNPAADAQARKDFPGLLKCNCRPARS
jgi:hypothetical protein